jgi:hypothetical protein
MKLRRLAYLGTFLTPVLFGCSDDATVLSVNINLSSDKLDRSNPAAWSAITVSVAGKQLPTTIAIQTEVVKVEMTDAGGMKSMVDVTQVKGRWFQRIDMPGGYQDGGAVTASATGAYKQTTKVGGMDMTTIVPNYAFSTEKKAGDKDPTINVDPDAAVIEEVSALFLNFNAPEPAPPPAAGGSGGGGAGGAPAATGGAATGGATGGSAPTTGGAPAATGGAPAATGGAAPMSQGGGGASGGGGATGGGGKASDAGGKAAGGNGGTTSSSGGGGRGGGGAGGTSAGSKS